MWRREQRGRGQHRHGVIDLTNARAGPCSTGVVLEDPVVSSPTRHYRPDRQCLERVVQAAGYVVELYLAIDRCETDVPSIPLGVGDRRYLCTVELDDDLSPGLGHIERIPLSKFQGRYRPVRQHLLVVGQEVDGADPPCSGHVDLERVHMRRALRPKHLERLVGLR